MDILKIPKLQFNKSKLVRSVTTTVLFLLASVSIAVSAPTIESQAADVTADGTKWVTAPSELPWAGSAEKQGLLFYLYNIKTGHISGEGEPFTLVPSYISNGEYWIAMVAGAGSFQSRLGSVSTKFYRDSSIPYPATYSSDEGTWTSTGGDTKSYLEEELSDGRQRWEDVVGLYWGYDLVDKIKKDRGETYRICFESVSAYVPYRSQNGKIEQLQDRNGNPRRVFNSNKTTGYAFKKYGIDIRYSTGAGSTVGTPNSKWIQSIANGMVFYDDEEAKLFNYKVKTAKSKVVGNGEMEDKGYGFATIKPTLTPIHTYNGTTPGDPEKPITDVTDGECSIYKLYYTQKYDKKGKLLEEKVDGGVHSQHKTTNYIVIDAEKGYVVEKWFIHSGLGTPSSNIDWWRNATGSPKGSGLYFICLSQ